MRGCSVRECNRFYVLAKASTFSDATGLHDRFRQKVHPIFQVEPMVWNFFHWNASLITLTLLDFGALEVFVNIRFLRIIYRVNAVDGQLVFSRMKLHNCMQACGWSRLMRVCFLSALSCVCVCSCGLVLTTSLDIHMYPHSSLRILENVRCKACLMLHIRAKP